MPFVVVFISLYFIITLKAPQHYKVQYEWGGFWANNMSKVMLPDIYPPKHPLYQPPRLIDVKAILAHH